MGVFLVDWTKKLEEDYGQDEMAMKLIAISRENGHSDEEIYSLMESFY